MPGFLEDRYAVRATWSPPAVSDDGHWTSFGASAAYASTAGVVITEDSALSIPTVWDCNKILTEALGQAPLLLYDRMADGARSRSEDRLAYRLREQPNDDQTAFEFKAEMQQAANFHRFAYAEIEWRAGEPVNIWPRHPTRIRVERTAAGRRYGYLEDDGRWRPILPDEMLRVRGTPVLRYAAQSLGQALALERYAGSLFRVGVKPSGLISTDPTTHYTDEARGKLKAAIAAEHGGPDKAGGVLMLPEGLKWTQLGMTNQQAELSALRAQVVAEASRWWRIPPYMLGLLESGTVSYASVTTQGVDFVVWTLMPWFTAWEQAVSRDLILRKTDQFAEFLAAALLRGTTRERYDVYAIALLWGIMSVNEIRRLENLNPRGGGDVFHTQANMTPDAKLLTPDTGSPADRLLRSLATDAAGRMVRREVSAMAKLAERTGADGPEWTAGVNDFYGGHGDTLAGALHVSKGEAHAYAARQRTELLAAGPAVLASWEQDGLIDDLTALALETTHA